MGRLLIFEKVDKVNLTNNKKKLKQINVSLGSGDAWPCYWRPYLIAAYRRIQSLTKKELEPFAKDYILSCISNVCPPTLTKNMQNTQYMQNDIYNPFAFLNFDPTDTDQISKKELFSKQNLPGLVFAGVKPIIDFAYIQLAFKLSQGYIDHDVIVRASQMMNLLKDWLPAKIEDLSDTIYKDNLSNYDLSDERYENLRESFNIAEKDPTIYAYVS